MESPRAQSKAMISQKLFFFDLAGPESTKFRLEDRTSWRRLWVKLAARVRGCLTRVMEATGEAMRSHLL
jgi:hypothetical protein